MEDYLFIVYTRKKDPISRLWFDSKMRQTNVLHKITVTHNGETVATLAREGFSISEACEAALSLANKFAEEAPLTSDGMEISVKIEISRRSKTSSPWTLRKTITQTGTLRRFKNQLKA